MSNTIVSSSPQVGLESYTTIPNQTQIAADFGGDAAAELAAMVFLFSRERSRQSSEQRDQIESQIREFENKEVQLLHQKADATYDAACLNSFGQIASGSAGAVGGAMNAGGSAWGGTVTASGTAVNGTFQLLAASDQRQADNLGVQAQLASNQADTYERSLDNVNTNSDDAKAMKDATMDFLQAIQESKAEGDKAMVNIRA